MPDNVTNEELYRLLCSIKEEHGDELKEIRRQTTATNGKVISASTRLDGHDREIKELKGHQLYHRQKRGSDQPDAITINVPATKKTVTLAVTVVGGIIAAAFTAAAKLMGFL